jgi:hypothetical protein
METIKFTIGNAKLGNHIAIFSLPAGYSCPMADKCLAFANVKTGKITDGKQAIFRCYAAMSEALFPNVRKLRWQNFNALQGKKKSEMIKIILNSLPKQQYVRIHQSGDFFSQVYFDSWIEIAKMNPDQIFYAYTKCLGFWVKRLNEIPDNLRLVASKGGKQDALIEKYKLRYVQVVYSEQEAQDLGLPIDHDDSHAYKYNMNFSLLIHSIQKAGSMAAKAKSALKGKGSYPVKKGGA